MISFQKSKENLSSRIINWEKNKTKELERLKEEYKFYEAVSDNPPESFGISDFHGSSKGGIYYHAKTIEDLINITEAVKPLPAGIHKAACTSFLQKDPEKETGEFTPIFPIWLRIKSPQFNTAYSTQEFNYFTEILGEVFQVKIFLKEEVSRITYEREDIKGGHIIKNVRLSHSTNFVEQIKWYAGEQYVNDFSLHSWDEENLTLAQLLMWEN